MGVLNARGPGDALIAALAALAGCYSPSLRDCTVSCGSVSDCASGQVCGADGLCAAPELAGRCAPDASVIDAPPDAATTASLRVEIAGKGSVIVDGRGTCSSLDPQRGKCMYDIAIGIAQRARATPIQVDQLFESWTSATCSSQGAICTFTPTGATTITVKFGHGGSQ